MPTVEQIRAARALIGWSQGDLAERSGLSQTGVARIENGTNRPNSSTMNKIIKAFDAHDIEFLGENGVKRRTNEIRTLRGKNAMSDFLDDVYETAVEHGTPKNPTPVYLSNVVHTNWVKWMGAERWEAHRKRMTKDKDVMDVRIITKEGDYNFLTLAYSEYKWMKEEYFNEKSFYSYHDRLAFLDFKENELVINIMIQPDFAKGYRDLFLIAWENIAITPSKDALTKLK